MGMKVKNPEKRVVFVGELTASKQSRNDALHGLIAVLKAVETKEFSMPEQQITALKDLQMCLLDLKPVEKEGKTKK